MDTTRIRYDRLWQGLRHATIVSPLRAAAWQGLPPAGEVPDPWAVWTLIGLVRHRRRQLWVGQVVTERLGGDLGRLAACGALGHPESRQPSGVVPGLAEWEYYFHGRGCCLTHRVTGERIDVDFFGDDAEAFDVWFYLKYLRSLRQPPGPERRLIELHPSFETVTMAFDALRDDGVLVTGGGINDSSSRGVRLAPGVLDHEAVIDDFCDAWDRERTRRPWMAALMGDWLATGELLRSGAGTGGESGTAAAANDQAVAKLAAGRADAVCRERAHRLAVGFGREEESRLCLSGLSDLSAPDLPAFLVRALQGAVSGTTSAAVEIVASRADAAGWCPDIYRLFRRLDPCGEPPHPHLWATCARFLLHHGYRPAAVAAALESAGSHAIGEAAMLALEHGPAAVAVGLFRRALRSTVPMNRCTAAAALALIDRPWSRAELAAVLAETEDQEATGECRAALAESRDPAARQAAANWEARNPHEPEPGQFITMREMGIRHAPEWLRHEMDALRERVMPLANRDPAAPE